MGKSEKAVRAEARVEITHLLAAYQRMIAAKGEPGRDSTRDGIALVLDQIYWGDMPAASLRRVFATILDEVNRRDLEAIIAAVRSEHEIMRESGHEVAA